MDIINKIDSFLKEEKIPKGLISWVADYIITKKEGNIGDAVKIKKNIDKEIKKLKLNSKSVYLYFGDIDNPKEKDVVYNKALKFGNVNESGKWSYVEGKIQVFIKNYKKEFPESNVYAGTRIKKVLKWGNPFTIISKNNIKTEFKNSKIINVLYGSDENEFVVLVLKRNDDKDIIVLGVENEPIPFDTKETPYQTYKEWMLSKK